MTLLLVVIKDQFKQDDVVWVWGATFFKNDFNILFLLFIDDRRKTYNKKNIESLDLS